MGGSDLDDPHDRLSPEKLEALREIGRGIAAAGNPFIQARVRELMEREREDHNAELCRADSAGQGKTATDLAYEDQMRRLGFEIMELRLQAAHGKTPVQRRINVYTCPNGHETVTVDLDDGVTPFMLRCRSGCAEMAQSSCYRVSPGKIPAWEWYRPGKAERRKLSRAMRAHVDQGGLVFRAISARRPGVDPTNLPPALKGARRMIREGAPRNAPSAGGKASRRAMAKRSRKANKGKR